VRRVGKVQLTWIIWCTSSLEISLTGTQYAGDTATASTKNHRLFIVFHFLTVVDQHRDLQRGQLAADRMVHRIVQEPSIRRVAHGLDPVSRLQLLLQRHQLLAAAADEVEMEPLLRQLDCVGPPDS
jgi:hypothetical protein